ncbi:MAG: DUF481 domain-containing protein [Chitinophagales bacterium]
MKPLIVLLLVNLFALKSECQILNIDKTDTSDYFRKSKFSVNFSTGLEIDKQKTTLYDATNTAESMWQEYRELFILAASYRFTYNGPDDILNAGYVHLKYRHNYKNKFQPEPFIQYQWDNNRGMVHRFLAGANCRYNFWKADKFEFNAGLGLMYEDEKWDYSAVDSSKIPAIAHPITNQLGKINSYIRLDWKPDNNNDITFNIFLQTRPDRFKPRIAPSLQWNIKAGKHIGFSILFSGLYDVAPVVPIEKFYYSLSNSLQFNF